MVLFACEVWWQRRWENVVECKIVRTQASGIVDIVMGAKLQRM